MAEKLREYRVKSERMPEGRKAVPDPDKLGVRSKLGGEPDWEQWPQEPKCRGCEKAMTFEHDAAEGVEEPGAVPERRGVFKLLYLASHNISRRWTMPIKNWSGALNQFAILFEGRVPTGGLTSNSLTQTS